MKCRGGSVGKYNGATWKLASGQRQYSPHVSVQEPNERNGKNTEL